MTPLWTVLAAHAGPEEILEHISADHSGLVQIHRGGEVLVQAAHGETAPDRPQPLSPTTPFWVGSISKQFTAAAALSLVEAGTLSLDQPVTSIFPEISPGALTRERAVCTVERLLQATCGIPRSIGSPVAYTGIGVDPSVQTRFLKAVMSTELAFAPGSEHLYSNAGYVLAGIMVERASGKSMSAVLAPLLERAGMADSGTAPQTIASFDDRVAWGQFYMLGRRWSGRWLRMGPRWPQNIGASGNIISTAEDLVRWTTALHGGALLSVESLEAMTTPAHDDYGMGLVIQGEPGGRLIWHNGALIPHGYNAAVAWLEESQTTIVVLNNQGLSLSAGNATRTMEQLTASLRGEAVSLEELETPNPKRHIASVMGAVQALLGPLLLLMAAGSLLRSPRHGKLSWAAGGIALATGAVRTLSTFVPLSQLALGFVVFGLSAALVRGLRRADEQPLFAAERRSGEVANFAIGVVLIAVFALLPMPAAQAIWTAGVLSAVVGITLLIDR